MMTRLFKSMSFIICFAMLIVPYKTIAASVRGNDDFIIILDRSGSMREKVPGNERLGFEGVENRYEALKVRGTIDAINAVVDTMLRKGDHFTVITFGTKNSKENPTVILSQYIEYDHEREVIKRTISEVLFKDDKTDIVAGLAEAKALVRSLKTPERRKILIMITDGVNDPDPESPYRTEEAQKEFYDKLQKDIESNKWNFFLVGLGEDTRENIHNIAQELELSSDNTVVVENIEDSRELTKKLKEIFDWAQKARVEAESKEIKLKLKPRLRGGYENGEDSVILTSFYGGEVEIKLKTNSPLGIEGSENLHISVTPLTLKLQPRQPDKFKFNISYTGERPDKGFINGKFVFQFSEASTPFYPHEGTFEIVLPSWWEVYGIYAIIGLTSIFIVFVLIGLAIRRSQVPEIRIAVTANDKPLGDPMTLRRKESFNIANGYFEGRSVSARGLNCKVAAKVRYMGRRKFEIEAVEAKIIDEGRELERMKIGMDTFFDLKDNDGKVLHLITISKPGRESDPFGGSDGRDPF